MDDVVVVRLDAGTAPQFDVQVPSIAHAFVVVLAAESRVPAEVHHLECVVLDADIIVGGFRFVLAIPTATAQEEEAGQQEDEEYVPHGVSLGAAI